MFACFNFFSYWKQTTKDDEEEEDSLNGQTGNILWNMKKKNHYKNGLKIDGANIVESWQNIIIKKTISNQISKKKQEFFLFKLSWIEK